MKICITLIMVLLLVPAMAAEMQTADDSTRAWINHDIRTVRDFRENTYEFGNINRDLEWSYSRIEHAIPGNKDGALNEVERLFWTYRDLDQLTSAYERLLRSLSYGGSLEPALMNIDRFRFERHTTDMSRFVRDINRNTDQLTSALRHDYMDRALRAIRAMKMDLRRLVDIQREFDWMLWDISHYYRGDADSRAVISNRDDLNREIWALERNKQRIENDVRFARMMINSSPNSSSSYIDSASWKARDIDFATWDFRNLYNHLTGDNEIDESLEDIDTARLYWAIQDLRDSVRDITSRCRTINSYIRMGQIDAASRYFWQLESAVRNLDRAISALRRL